MTCGAPASGQGGGGKGRGQGTLPLTRPLAVSMAPASGSIHTMSQPPGAWASPARPSRFCDPRVCEDSACSVTPWPSQEEAWNSVSSLEPRSLSYVLSGDPRVPGRLWQLTRNLPSVKCQALLESLVNEARVTEFGTRDRRSGRSVVDLCCVCARTRTSTFVFGHVGIPR